VNRSTFDSLVLQHLSAAQRFAIRLVGNPADAEDLVQEALLRASRRWRSFRGQSRFTTWLFQIIVNCFRDRLRTRGKETLADDHVDARLVNPIDAAAGKEIGEIVAAAVSLLPPRQREVLVLVAYENLSVVEAAEVLGITAGNARVHLHLARERLKTQLSRLLDGIANG
jgi:RNA polymerase sigma-70 factor (ECF subfamily)